MGNSSSSNNNCNNCNTCSQKGLYFGFGKTEVKKLYYNNRVVNQDSKGKFIKVDGKKKYLPKGAKLTSVKKPPPAKKPAKKPVKKPAKKPVKKPKGYYLKKKIKSPEKKVVKNKNKKVIGERLSARAQFNKGGMSVVGKKYLILQKDGTYKEKVLRLRVNGSPYFANKFGNELCKSNGSIHLNLPMNKFGKNMCFGS